MSAEEEQKEKMIVEEEENEQKLQEKVPIDQLQLKLVMDCFEKLNLSKEHERKFLDLLEDQFDLQIARFGYDFDEVAA